MPGSPAILQIIPRLDTGGAETTTLEMVEAIRAAGGRALVATEGGRLAREVEALGGELIAFPAAAKSPLKILRNAARLLRIARREGIALLHVRSRAPAWSGLLAARRAGLPFVTTYHGAYGGRWALKTWYNGVMARGDRVIANSAYTARLIAERHGTEASRIRVIARGVDLERFDPARVEPARLEALRTSWGASADDRIVLQAARLTGWKGQRVLIEAARLICARHGGPAPLFVLAGDAQGRDGYVEELEQQIATAGLTGRVRLVGHCADIAAAFRAASVTVVASTEPEAFGRATTEALAMGSPVVVTDLGAPPETLRPQGGEQGPPLGSIVPPGDAPSLAAAIEGALAMSDAERTAHALRARAHVSRGFSKRRLQAETLAVYDELIGSDLAARLPETSPAASGAA